MPDKMLSVEEVADELSVNPETAVTLSEAMVG